MGDGPKRLARDYSTECTKIALSICDFHCPRHRGKKSIHHHRGTPPFSVCRPTPRSQSKKSYGVYHFPGKTREKGIHHRSGKKGIHHRTSDPEKEKRRVSTVVVYLFFFPATFAISTAPDSRAIDCLGFIPQTWVTIAFCDCQRLALRVRVLAQDLKRPRRDPQTPRDTREETLEETPALVAQCSATPATVAATPPCSATPFQTQISVRHLPAQGGGGATPKFFGGVTRHRCYTCKTL